MVALCFSPNGKWLVSGSTDQTARLWNVETGQATGAELQHSSAVWTATFSNDSRLVTTGCGDGTIHVWDVATGAPVGPVRQHRATVWCLASDPSSNTFWSAGEDRQLCRWPLPCAPPQLSSTKLGIEVLTGMEFDPHQAARWLDARHWRQRQRELRTLQQQEGPALDE